MSSDAENLENLQIAYQAGKAAFERGDYRQSIERLEQATALVSPGSRLGGEVQTWLVTAYEAAGRQAEAIDLCRKLSVHPDYLTRKQGKRLLYILEAPKLQTRPEWLTEIPDLGKLSDRSTAEAAGGSRQTTPSRSTSSQILSEPIDPSQIKTQDNQFVWFALLTVGLVLGGVLWLS
ncbi:MAG TPA: tetratricopeptide repeat protein [Thermosynechococcaceae cyanobacterium]